MAYPDLLLADIQVVGVFEAGIPNKERVIIRPNRQISLVGVGIAVGLSAGDAGALPLFDNVFWFPEIIVEPPTWIFVYTGKGKTRQTTLATKDPALVFHWQRNATVFIKPDIVPIVFQVGFSEVAKHYNF